MDNIKKNLTTTFVKVFGFNFGLIAFGSAYLLLRFEYLNKLIPLWYTMPWGTQQLTTRVHIFVLPALMALITSCSVVLIYFMKKFYLRYGTTLMYAFTTLCNLLLSYAIVRTIIVASSPFKPIIKPEYLNLMAPILVSFLVVYFATPKLMEKIKEKGVVTDPQKHNHPGMILTQPSARGGGVIFTLGVLVAALFFTKLTPTVVGLLISMVLAAIIGFADDLQNTKPISKLKKLENPFIRFGLQILVILPIIIAGVQIKFISNPFNGIIHLDALKFNLLGTAILPIAIGFTIFWMLWIMNLLSWANGVDGQYSGMVGIAAVVIAVITMRETPLTIEQQNMVNLAAITAGASFGLLPYSWYPAKIMWGFGAITAGISLATISTLTEAKIATALIVLLVPFLDGVVTILRRILSGNSPLKGDRGHLHHLLLQKGWGRRRIAVFYWVATLLSGYIGIMSADKDPLLTAITLGGFAAFFIILTNIKARRSQ
jgi:UDP-GlcNAc:undecaprenyl-phosphate/decaprenyl-phosphate GlcNAc-1-phosphate transferase